MSRRARVIAALLLLVLAALGPRAIASSGLFGIAGHRATAPSPQIKHLIVVLQSDHSFDNYFGTRPDVDGIPGGVCEPVSRGSKTCVKPFLLTPDESRAGLNDSARSMGKAIDGGKMDGFVAAQHNPATGTTAMGYYDRSTLGYYWALADHYTLFDHFFASTPGGPLVNRLFAVAGQAGSATDGTPPPNGVDVPTIFDELQKAGLSWKFYVQNHPAAGPADKGTQDRVPLFTMPRVLSNPAMASQIVDVEQYYQDLQNGTLPIVSYVASSVDSESPPQSPDGGEAFVRSLLNALMQNNAWNTTAVLLTYDNSGGWYDHVAPPTLNPSAPGLPLTGTAQSLGLRVPAILIGPYARPGAVDHQQLDFTSILRFIEQNWHLAPLTARDATAASIGSGLNMQQAPIPAHIVSAPSPAEAFVRPHVTVIYGLYLGALAIVAMLVLAAIRSNRRMAGRSPVRAGVTATSQI
jgi:phospholipase C